MEKTAASPPLASEAARRSGELLRIAAASSASRACFACVASNQGTVRSITHRTTIEAALTLVRFYQPIDHHRFEKKKHVFNLSFAV